MLQGLKKANGLFNRWWVVFKGWLPSMKGSGKLQYGWINTVSTVGLDEEMIRKYVRWQQKKDRENDAAEQQELDLDNGRP